MIQSGKTAQAFIQESFSPNVAILCSPKVGSVTSKNNLTFTELLQPFTNLEIEGQLREPGGGLCNIKNWRLITKDVLWKPLQPTEARKQLNNAVMNNYNDKTKTFECDGREYAIPQATPWFDAWRETYLEVQFPSDHEYTKHFVSCILVATTNEDNIIDTFNGLNQQYAQLQNVTPPKLPKWFNTGVLKSYLLLHDVSSSVTQEKANTVFETLKENFGVSNCFMLSINSRVSEETIQSDYWATCIKRISDTNNEMVSSLATSPLEPRPAFQSTTVITSDDSNQTRVSDIQEGLHPLTTTDVDVYDSANSLQTYSFSGSSESVNVIGKGLDNLTEVHGGALNSSDIDAIKKFLQEYATKALLPYLEKQISQLSEVVANRKGVSRSLLSATKRWFGTGKGGGNTTGNNTVIYTSDCPELQLRRLGDLYFMCGQWQRAFDVYHTAKREFYADSAWLCYAGALEMAALSAFMAGEAQRKTHGYMEESILTYLNTCRMVQYAVRATLLSALCLTSAGLHGEAAKQLIRMTSEDSDLRSAMLLEQAAFCFLSGPGSKAMTRKYAFHMVLAGHRFSKAGQKKHAYRCYQQAYQVYENSGWRLSTDHVQFALGRLAGALRDRAAAVRWLARPLAPHADHQPAHQQAAFLREYLAAHQQWIENSDEFKDCLPELPLPLVDHEATTVLCVGPAPLSSPGRVPASSLSLTDITDSWQDQKYWDKMEEMLLQVVQGTVPMIFRPTIDLYTQKTDANPTVPQGEPIQISVTLRNPLNISLILKDVELLWQFVATQNVTDVSSVILNNEPVVAAGEVLETSIIFGQKLKSVLLAGESQEVLTFLMTPMQVGELFIRGIAYRLINAGETGTETGGLAITGKLNLSSENSDKRLHIMVIPHAPCLQMTFSETSSVALSGEIRSVDVELRNVGPVDMGAVHFAVSHPDCLSLADDQQNDFSVLYDHKYREPVKLSDERAERLQAWRSAASRHVKCAAGGVARGGCARARLLLRPRAASPALFLLAYYQSDAHSRGYRLLRHVFRFNVSEVVEISVTPRRSLRVLEGDMFENMNLAVEVKNICNEKDQNVTVQVLEASLLSRQWKLTDLTAARNKDETLSAHEKIHLVMKARRFSEIPSEGSVEWSCLKVANDPSNEHNVNVPPYSKFITEYNPPFIETPDSMQDKVTTGLIQSMFILRWKAYDKGKAKHVIGQHCLWLDCFTKALSREREHITAEAPALQFDEYDSNTDLLESKNKKIKESMVICRMEHSNFIDHDFKLRKLCLVPITINIVNCYGIPVKVFIDMSKQQSRESSRELGWAGALCAADDDGKEIGLSVSLDRFESRRVCVSAVCAAPGTYRVGAAFLITTARADTNQSVTHLANNASLLVVTQTA